ncbi:MAG: hypothetical protein HGA76_00545 [Candidatus Firestonebacteria bacterium]|nr:hypothetical protein [Candidatus Firestonebacteria bacterium]
MKGSWLGVAIFLLGTWPGVGNAGVSDSAGTESPFELGLGARALALGKAFTAIADDATTVYWNPGGLGLLNQKEAAACHVFLNEGTLYDTLAYVHPVYEVGTVGLAGLHIQTGGIERRDDHDYLQGTFDYQQSEGLIALGRELFPGFGAGLTFKVEQQILDTYQATGYGMDLGFLYSPHKTFSVGLMLQNAMPPQMQLKEPVSMLLNARLGTAYRWVVDKSENNVVLFSVEVEKPGYDLWLLHGGMEYRIFHILSLRAGWDRDRPMGGVGLAFKGLALDYAVTYRELSGTMHIASLSWRFGLPVEELEKARQQKLTEEIFKDTTRAQFQQHRNTGVAELNREHYLNAAKEFKQALGWQADAQTQAELARAQKLNDAQTARQYYQQGLDKAQHGQGLEAWAMFSEAGKLNPADVGVQTQLRALKEQLLDRARNTFLKAKYKKLRAHFVAALNDYLEGQYAKAAGGWQAVLEAKPDYPEARDYQLQARQALLRQQTMITAIDPAQDAKVKVKLAEALALYDHRQIKAAQNSWQQALALDPSCETAQLGLERTELLLKTLELQGVP